MQALSRDIAQLKVKKLNYYRYCYPRTERRKHGLKAALLSFSFS